MRQKTLSALCLILLLALSLLAVPVAAGEGFDASAMRLARFEGDVQILNAEGVPRFVLENVRFASGESMETGEDGSASVALDDSKIVTLDESTAVQFVLEEQHMLLNGEDVTAHLRTPEISAAASAVSALPEVRAFLLQTQRDLAAKGGVVMDGRDIGTVVLPEAELKVFLTASPEERARRRFLELREKGIDQPYEEVLREMNERDLRDSTRAVAPLRPAEDAVLLDSSELDPEQVLERLVALFREKSGEAPDPCG